MKSGDIYTDDGGRSYHAGKRFVEDYVHDAVKKNRAIQFQPYIKATDKVLEFGVGAGWNLAAITAAQKTGFDVATAMKSIVESNGIEFLSDLEDVPKEHFDVVLCSHVLEHVPDPLSTLKRFRDFLKVGGRLILCVPTDLEKKYYRFNRADKDRHLFCWNNQTLSMLTETAGFELLETRRRPFGYSVRAAKLMNQFRLPQSMYRTIWKTLNYVKPCPEVFVHAQRTD